MQKIISILFPMIGIMFLAPAALAQTGAAKPAASPTPVKLPVLSQVLSAMAGPRRELTGTGLSVQSPESFLLKQDKPDPFIEKQTANVFWALSHRGIFANVRYTKETGGKAPRQELESVAKLVSETNGSPTPRIVDTTFLGSPAVQFEGEFVDAYDPQKVKRKRRMLAFGTAGEITTIQISYPAGETAVAALAEQIFKSFQKAGAAAQGVSKMPPANWQYHTLKGLRFEVPDAGGARLCDSTRIKGPVIYRSSQVCFPWDGNTIARAEYREYTGAVPTPMEAAQSYIKISKQIDLETNTAAQRTYTAENVTIAGAEAVKVKAYAAYSSAGTNEEIVFIRRGRDFWTLHTYEFIRWNYTREAVQRILTSIKF